MSYNTFREYLDESTKIGNEFDISINGIAFRVEREFHVRQPRGNLKIPRDGGLSINKYKTILEKALPYMLKDDVYSITWTSNNKNNLISLTKRNNTFSIFGAIIKSTDDIDKLYKKAINRINLGLINF